MSGPEVFADGRAVLPLVGDVDMETAPTIVKVVEVLAQDGCQSIWFDCTLLDFMDAAGLKALLLAKKLLEPEGGIVLYRPPDVIRRLLAVTGMDLIVPVEDEPGWIRPSERRVDAGTWSAIQACGTGVTRARVTW